MPKLLSLPRRLVAAVAVTLLVLGAGCAATYRPPTTPKTDFVRPASASKRELFDATKQAFVLEGYSIAESDFEVGVISTARRQVDLDEQHCDCGTTLGLPYIRDKRTITSVSFGAVVVEGRLTLQANIDGEYLRGVDVSQSIAFDCVSKGVLETRMYERITAGLMR